MIMIFQLVIQISVQMQAFSGHRYVIWITECLHLHLNLYIHLKDYDQGFNYMYGLPSRKLVEREKIAPNMKLFLSQFFRSFDAINMSSVSNNKISD